MVNYPNFSSEHILLRRRRKDAHKIGKGFDEIEILFELV